jgi:hypothetical protein
MLIFKLLSLLLIQLAQSDKQLRHDSSGGVSENCVNGTKTVLCEETCCLLSINECAEERRQCSKDADDDQIKTILCIITAGGIVWLGVLVYKHYKRVLLEDQKAQMNLHWKEDEKAKKASRPYSD